MVSESFAIILHFKLRKEIGQNTFPFHPTTLFMVKRVTIFSSHKFRRLYLKVGYKMIKHFYNLPWEYSLDHGSLFNGRLNHCTVRFDVNIHAVIGLVKQLPVATEFVSPKFEKGLLNVL